MNHIKFDRKYHFVILLILCMYPVVQAGDLSKLKQRLNQIELQNYGLLQMIRRLETGNLTGDEAFQKKEDVTVLSPATKKPFKSKVSLKYYRDLDEYSTFELVTDMTRLPLSFTFWRFTDLHGNQNSGDEYIDFNPFFME